MCRTPPLGATLARLSSGTMARGLNVQGGSFFIRHAYVRARFAPVPPMGFARRSLVSAIPRMNAWFARSGTLIELGRTDELPMARVPRIFSPRARRPVGARDASEAKTLRRNIGKGHREQRVLQDVLRVLRIAAHLQLKPVRLRLVALEQLLEPDHVHRPSEPQDLACSLQSDVPSSSVTFFRLSGMVR